MIRAIGDTFPRDHAFAPVVELSVRRQKSNFRKNQIGQGGRVGKDGQIFERGLQFHPIDLIGERDVVEAIQHVGAAEDPAEHGESAVDGVQTRIIGEVKEPLRAG